jgi:hypothetical protein
MTYRMARTPHPLCRRVIHGGLRGLLSARVQCAISSISPFFTAVLQPRTAPPDPSGVLHITTSVTLCEAYMGIEPQFDLLNHFFHARLLQYSGVEVAVLGVVDYNTLIFTKERKL